MIMLSVGISNSIGDEGECQGKMGVNSDGFLQCQTRGASTLDLIVVVCM